MSSEGPYGRQGFQSNPTGYGSGGGDYTQQPAYGYGGGAAYGAPAPPPSPGGYEYNPYGGESSYEVRSIQASSWSENVAVLQSDSHGQATMRKSF